MANPVPCGICNQVDSAEFLVTDMTPDFSLLGKPTMGVCASCWIMLGDAMKTALEDTSENPAPDTPVGTGALEQVEQDEGAVSPAPSPARPKSRRKTAPESNGATVPEEAPASHGNV